MTNTKPTPRLMHVCVPLLSLTGGKWEFHHFSLDMVHYDRARTAGARFRQALEKEMPRISTVLLYGLRPHIAPLTMHGTVEMVPITPPTVLVDGFEVCLGSLYTQMCSVADWNVRGEAVVFLFVPSAPDVPSDIAKRMVEYGTAILARNDPAPTELCLPPTRDITALELVRLAQYYELHLFMHTKRMNEAVKKAFEDAGHTAPVPMSKDQVLSAYRCADALMVVHDSRVLAYESLGFRLEPLGAALHGADLESVCIGTDHSFYKVTSPAFL